jgi:NAD(P)-dependent dehydrogenase (short-subunit alcohol dehydrogenase family)
MVNHRKIVTISSSHAVASFNWWTAYDTAKGGVNALTRNIAVEYAPIGIRANAIEPDGIRTPLMQHVIDDSPDHVRAEHNAAALHPLGRIGEPHEIAGVASFLLSSDTSFLTGQCIAVDGRATARCCPYPRAEDLLRSYGVES